MKRCRPSTAGNEWKGTKHEQVREVQVRRMPSSSSKPRLQAQRCSKHSAHARLVGAHRQAATPHPTPAAPCSPVPAMRRVLLYLRPDSCSTRRGKSWAASCVGGLGEVPGAGRRVSKSPLCTLPMAVPHSANGSACSPDISRSRCHHCHPPAGLPVRRCRCRRPLPRSARAAPPAGPVP